MLKIQLLINQIVNQDDDFFALLYTHLTILHVDFFYLNTKSYNLIFYVRCNKNNYKNMNRTNVPESLISRLVE